MSNVVYFTSTMSGAPTLTNTAGSLIGILDACLVDGLGSVTLDSLVVASDVATATVSGGHQFAMVGACGPVIRISGANPSGLNGDWRVTVTSATQFTFATTGISDQTATGTIAAKRAPAGFSKAFSGTNKAAYRADDITGTRLYLRVDDSNATYAIVRGYEVMTDVDTGTGLFPTAAQAAVGAYVYKATTTAVPWVLVADGRMGYFFCDTAKNGTWYGGLAFGDLESYCSPDAYGCLLIAATTSSGAFQLYQLNNSAGSWLARAASQTGGSLTSSRYSHQKCTQLGGGGESFPALTDNGLHFWPVEAWNTNVSSRGLLPGLFCPVHAGGSVPHGFTFERLGRTYQAVNVGASNYQAILDVSGPWRA